MRTGMTTTIINGACDIGINAGHRTSKRVFAKAGFTNPIPQKMRRTKKYCGFLQNKGHEFHNIFKFCGTTPQIIPTHFFFRPVKYFVENRFRFRKSISTSDSTNKIRTFFVKLRFVNSAFANTLLLVLCPAFIPISQAPFMIVVVMPVRIPTTCN